MEWSTGLGKLLVIAGAVLVVVGLAVWGKLPLGRLPGDVRIERDGYIIYFPITTMLLISAILTLISYLYRRH